MTKSVEPILLDHRVDLYIPSQCICGNSLPEHPRNKVIEEVKSNFDKWFDGHAEILIRGDWPLPDGTIAREEVADIYSFCTGEALEQHQEDVDHLAIEIANRLTQDRVLRVFDNLKVALWPNTLKNLQPKKNCACFGGATVGIGITVRPMEIGKADRLSKMLVIQGILRSFKSADHARKLFCDVLNYQYASGELPCAKWPDGLCSLLIGAPTILADHNGFKVVYLHISSDDLRRGAERQVIQRICKDDPTFRGLFVVSNQAQTNWELVNAKLHCDESSRLVLRRMRIGVDAVRTATERMAALEIAEEEEASVAPEELQGRLDKAFDVEAVTKAFFADVANWYFWALKHVSFPKDAPKEKDGHDHVSVIRLITRLIFCWFVKEKGLIRAELFDEKKLADLLVGFAPRKASKKDSVFYKAILQNLFFATLNMEMNNRDWRRNGQNFMAHSLYRHKNLFAHPDEALGLFKNIPFLNGGLFECLDKIVGDKDNPRYIRIDGFSDRTDSQPTVPDFLFFGEEREVDLSEAYGDKKFKKVKIRGLIHTLNHYHFTVEESTPLEEEVALDPELAGKIFENLLAAYNPETGATARKQTGSFYTPREIVNYMVDETLIAYLKGMVEEAFPKAGDVEPRLRHLFSYEDEGHRFTPKEVEILIAGIDNLKALDPAVGSGAFPMSILHKLVFILRRLDPRNEQWKERQKQRLRVAIGAAELVEDATTRENTLRELEQQVAGIEEAFEKNTLDYGRKLYLIENCLYGVDIQPIAVQIAKMRFFISLIADQKVDHEAINLGVRPLPNLETKLVAANTLIGIDKPKQMALRNQQIDDLENDLWRVRERHFLARTPTTKAKCREQDKRLRKEIAKLLKKDGWKDKIAMQLAGWDPYDQNASSSFFDSEWMFGMREGFDVVIGNPPYVSALEFARIFGDEIRNQLNSLYESATGAYDYYVLFFEQGLKLCIDAGYLTFISPNKYLSAKYAIGLRKWLLQHANLQSLLDVSRIPVFEEASVYPVVSFYCKSDEKGTKVRVSLPKSAEHLDHFSIERYVESNIPSEWLQLLPENIWGFLLSRNANLLPKILKSTRPLSTFGEVNATSTAGEADEYGKYIASRQGADSMKVINTGTINKFVSLWGFHELTHGGQKFLTPYLPLSKAKVTGRRKSMYKAPKVIFAKMAKICEAMVDVAGEYASLNTNCFYKPKNDVSLKYIAGICNSRMFMFLYDLFFGALRMSGGYYQFQAPQLRVVPIPFADGGQQKTISDLVTHILAAKGHKPTICTTSLEHEIDEIVYKLYGLTKDEINIVEGGR